MRLCLGRIVKQRVLRLTMAVSRSRGLGQERGKVLDFSDAFHLHPIVVLHLVGTRTKEEIQAIGKACLIQYFFHIALI